MRRRDRIRLYPNVPFKARGADTAGPAVEARHAHGVRTALRTGAAASHISTAYRGEIREMLLNLRVLPAEEGLHSMTSQIKMKLRSDFSDFAIQAHAFRH